MSREVAEIKSKRINKMNQSYIPAYGGICIPDTEREFPSISAESLAGNLKTLPDDVRGYVAFISVAFERHAQDMIDSWVKPLKDALDIYRDILFFEIPVIDSPFWRMMKGIIDTGMRGGTPDEEQDHVLTYYGSSEHLRKALGIWDRSLAYIFLIDREGFIRWRGKGYATDDALVQVVEIARTI